jgi:hypothetical protein
MTGSTSHDAMGGGKAVRVTAAATSSRALGLHLLVVLVVSASGAALVGGSRAAISTAIGIGLAALNLMVMRRIVHALTAADGQGAVWALAFPAKLVAVVGGAFVLVDRDIAEPVPLAIGFALLPLSGVFLRRGGSAAQARPTRANPQSVS